MLIVHVDVHVKPEFLEAFKAATLENARNSVQEPGVAASDVMRSSRPGAFCPRRGLPHRGRHRAPQGDRALRNVTRRGGQDDGCPTHERQVRKSVPG